MTRISAFTGGFSGYRAMSRSFAVSGGSEYTGSTMVFVQTDAPVGWTKVTTYNDYALRVVSGPVSSGGTVNFSSVYTSQTVEGSVSGTGSVGSTTLSTPQLPVHTHNATAVFPLAFVSSGPPSALYGGTNAAVSSSVGAGGSHTHGISTSGMTFTGSPLNLSIKYVDTILATKD